jgi:raffinose/stachyose/melibiose transport system substrate-binding protein
VTLTYWTTASAGTNAIHKLLSGFEAATGATIEIVNFPDPFEQNFLTRWATGDRPDFFNFHPVYSWFVRLNPSETLVDLSAEAFVKQTKFNLMDSAGNENGKHYAAVITYPYLTGMLYNKTVFADAGLTVPTNLDEFWAACTTFQAKFPGKTFMYAGGGDMWPLQIFPFDLWADDVKAGIMNEVNAGTTKFTDPRFVAGAQALQDAITKGCVNKDIITAGYDGELKNLTDGSAAMISQGSWAIGSLIDAIGLDKVNSTIGYFPLSAKSATASWQVSQGGSFFVPKNADPKKQEAALAFIRYATSVGYAQYLKDSKDLPVLEGFDTPVDVSTPLLEANEAFLKGSAPAFSMVVDAPYGDFHVFLNEMINGTKTPLQVMEAVQREYERAKAAMGK